MEQSVYSEYHTYLRNKESKSISYAHVDSANIFKFIEQILTLPRNNPTQTFEKFSDIEKWLREQWAGLFRELLRRMSEQQKFSELSQQVDGLKEINTTLKTYLESLMKGVSPDESGKLIESESQRLIEKERLESVRKNELAVYLRSNFDIDIKDIVKAATVAKSSIGFARDVSQYSSKSDSEADLIDLFEKHPRPAADLNQIRKILGLKFFRKVKAKSSK